MGKLILTILTILLCLSSYADSGPFDSCGKGYFKVKHFTPLQFSIMPFWQLFDTSSHPVYGGAFGFIGYNHEVAGLRIGVASATTKNRAVSISALVDYCDENCGLMLAPWNLHSKNSGLAIGVFNKSGKRNNGVTLGVMNFSNGYYRDNFGKGKPQPVTNRVQVGVVNIANNGWQFGLFNYNKNSILPYSILFNYSAPEKQTEEAIKND